MGALRNEKLKTGTFKHIESELYSYWESVEELKRLKADVLYSTPTFDDVGGGKSNIPSDPTSRKVTVLLTHRRIEQLEKVVESIRKVYGKLPDDKRKLVQLKYWTVPQTLNWEGIAQKIPVSRRTAINWRDEIVYKIADELGWR